MTKSPQKITVADMETDPFKYGRVPRPFAVGVYDGTNYGESWGDDCVQEFVAYCHSRCETIFFHNGGRFDFFFLLPYAKSIKMIKNRIAQMKIGRCTLRDSYLLVDLPLAASSKDTTFDYRKMEKDIRDGHKEEISAYLRKDCLALHELIAGFDKEVGVDKLTTPSKALDILKSMGYDIPDIGESRDSERRKYYYGGMVGGIRGHYTNMVHVDINSSYPTAMLEEHPWGEGSYLSESPTERIWQGTLIADAVPYWPIRSKKGLRYERAGTHEYNITNWEYEAAQRNGLLGEHKFLAVDNYPDTTDFSDYVLRHYDLKLKAEREGHKLNRIFAKLLLNSLYGKFAQDPRKFSEHEITSLEDKPPEGDGWEIMSMTENDMVIWVRPSPGDKFLNVATSASVTGYARAALTDAICKADTPVYWDTDCIICKNPGSIPMGDGLGEWSTEATYDECWIVQRKIYTAVKPDGSTTTKSKGARLTHQEVVDMAGGAPIQWTSEAPSFSLAKAPTFLKRKLHYPVDSNDGIAYI